MPSVSHPVAPLFLMSRFQAIYQYFLYFCILVGFGWRLGPPIAHPFEQLEAISISHFRIVLLLTFLLLGPGLG